jgi:hypothetical protein
MNIYKFYDAFCVKCGEWYGSKHKQPQGNKRGAIKEIKNNGWGIRNGDVMCTVCIETEGKE